MKLILFLLLTFLSYSWKCGGARSFIKFPSDLRPSSNPRSSSYSPIRIKYEYMSFDLGSDKLNSYFKSTLLDSVNSFFKNTMKVKAVQTNLTVTESECIDVDVPEHHLQYGIPDADLVIYITTVNEKDDGYIAYAGYCQLDTNFRDIPIMGEVTINIPQFIYSDFSSHYSTVVHELYHVFGFNSELYNFWKQEDGSPYKPGDVYEDIIIRGVNKTILKTPNILAEARKHFACESLKGIELEEYGGEATAGSHWDMRIMYNDYMMGKDIEDPIYTTITLALLKDTGWYDIDLSYGTPPMFGYKAGCEFFEEPCLKNSVSNFPALFCDKKTEGITCDAFYLRKASCLIQEFESVPKYFQYFNNSVLLGGDEYADYCPTFKAQPGGDCRSKSTSDTLVRPGSTEVVGPRSRCFESTLNKNKKLSNYAACYEVTKCTNSGAFLKIGRERVYCPFTGGSLKVRGYYGEITCPEGDILCKNFPCIDGCSGHGKCLNGVCLCDKGFGGYSCIDRTN